MKRGKGKKKLRQRRRKENEVLEGMEYEGGKEVEVNVEE